MGNPNPISNDSILELLRNAANALGHPPTRRQFKKLYNYPSSSLIQARFGGWKEALKLAGLREAPNVRSKKPIPTREEAIADIHRVAKMFGGHISAPLYFEHGKYAKYTVLRATGCTGLTELYEQLGYVTFFNKSKEHVSETLLAVVKDLGYTPGIAYFIKHPLCDFSTKAVYNHYNSYQDLLNELNLPPVRPTPKKSRFMSKDGHSVQSRFERTIDNFLYENHLAHAIQVPISKERNWTCDFYIPALDLYIEADGLLDNRPDSTSLNEKLQFYKDNNYNFLVVHPSDWKDVLLEFTLP